MTIKQQILGFDNEGLQKIISEKTLKPGFRISALLTQTNEDNTTLHHHRGNLEVLDENTIKFNATKPDYNVRPFEVQFTKDEINLQDIGTIPNNSIGQFLDIFFPRQDRITWSPGKER